MVGPVLASIKYEILCILRNVILLMLPHFDALDGFYSQWAASCQFVQQYLVQLIFIAVIITVLTSWIINLFNFLKILLFAHKSHSFDRLFLLLIRQWHKSCFLKWPMVMQILFLSLLHWCTLRCYCLLDYTSVINKIDCCVFVKGGNLPWMIKKIYLNYISIISQFFLNFI